MDKTPAKFAKARQTLLALIRSKQSKINSSRALQRPAKSQIVMNTPINEDDSSSCLPRHVVIIAGPTGGGKARLAMAVAAGTGALLISCDSMKIYRRMDIGTAKPSLQAQSEFDWRCLNLVEPWEDFDSARWVERAEKALKEAKQLGRPAIVSGGTSLYIKALTEGLFTGPGRDDALREELKQLSAEALHQKLQSVDPASAQRLHPNDVRRVIRAIEVFTLTGESITARQKQFGQLKPGLSRSLFFVRREKDDMDERINSRVERMMAAGWLDECKALLKLKEPLANGPMQAIGYQQLFDFIQAGGNLDEAVTKIKTKTRRFARRQITWFKHFPDARLLVTDKDQSPSQDHVEEVIAALNHLPGTDPASDS
jgi:tRNA dimethylallyltransferase